MKKSHAKWTLMCKILKPLACSDRLGMFALLDNKDRNIEQLSWESKMCESSVSRHLRVLHNSGLIKKTKRGQQVFYRLDKFGCHLADDLERMTNCILSKHLGSN